MTHSPAQVVAQLLVDMGLGSDPEASPLQAWPTYYSAEPGTPDQVLVVYDTAGRTRGRIMVSGEAGVSYGVQVYLRSKDHRTGQTKMSAIRTSLSESVYQRTVNISASSYLVHAFVNIGDIMVLGKESPTSKRNLFTLNALVVIKQT